MKDTSTAWSINSSDKFVAELATLGFQTLRNVMAPPPSATEVIKVEADSPLAVRRAAEVVRRNAYDKTLFAPTVLPIGGLDTSGDPQVGIDRELHTALQARATLQGIRVFGEEDQFREVGAEGPLLRGAAIRECLKRGEPFVIADALDGSHQFVAMMQPGAYGVCCIHVDSHRRVSAALALGTGLMLTTTGQSVFVTNLLDDLDGDSRELDALVIRRSAHYKRLWVIPGTKPDRLYDAARTMEWARANLDPSLQPSLIDPLAGTPGIVSALLLAPGGAVAAYQPESWAWDHVAAYFCASLGLEIITEVTGQRLVSKQIPELFLRDLGDGTKTEGMIIGKSRLEADTLREALLKGREGQSQL